MPLYSVGTGVVVGVAAYPIREQVAVIVTGAGKPIHTRQPVGCIIRSNYPSLKCSARSAGCHGIVGAAEIGTITVIGAHQAVEQVVGVDDGL